MFIHPFFPGVAFGGHARYSGVSEIAQNSCQHDQLT